VVNACTIVTWKTETWNTVVQGQPRQIVCEDPISKILRTGVAQEVEYLLCKGKALSSNPSSPHHTPTRKEQERKKKRDELQYLLHRTDKTLSNATWSSGLHTTEQSCSMNDQAFITWWRTIIRYDCSGLSMLWDVSVLSR
jgi:hypothetical protein